MPSTRADLVAFWSHWTRAEVAAKLQDVPILLWLRRYSVELPDDLHVSGPTEVGHLMLRTLVLEQMVVTVGAIHWSSRTDV
ncbi:hypothetical protein [Leekyejoonella antrihumi]|uniref:Uncharacterized protein n=1 Tax=Leekyejoonella antrihumi TaxID=1660198 RepID=A0A563DY78_9MICO|nr:hypothetical protein [Leekyejoonella antrihumi]TWP35079.1 hypothetical protein FGL98_15090 [Leekyejoonella antrihumi]